MHRQPVQDGRKDILRRSPQSSVASVSSPHTSSSFLPPVTPRQSYDGVHADHKNTGTPANRRDNLQMQLWEMQEKYAATRQNAIDSPVRGIVLKSLSKDRVDVSGRTMTIRNFSGRKVRASQHEFVQQLSMQSPQVFPDGLYRSVHDLNVDAGIQAWKIHHTPSRKWFDAEGEQRAQDMAVSAGKIRKSGHQIVDEDDFHVLTQPPPSWLGHRSFLKGMLDPAAQDNTESAHGNFEPSVELIAALKTPPKDRQYEDLEHITEFMDGLTDEPFASMNEFEKLKAAMICEVSTASHGSAVIKRGEKPNKLFVLVQGRVSIYDFRLALQKFEKDRRVAFKNVRDAADDSGEAVDVDTFQEEWQEKSQQYFDQTYRLGEMAESGRLPENTKHTQRTPGVVCGHEIMVSDEHFVADMNTRTVVSTCEKNSQNLFLSLNKANCETLAEIVHTDWGEKAQLLRSIRLTSGVSKLGVKMLAMQAQLQDIAPNTIIAPQGSSPSLIYVIKRGFVRIVKKMMPEVKKKETLASRHSQVWYCVVVYDGACTCCACMHSGYYIYFCVYVYTHKCIYAHRFSECHISSCGSFMWSYLTHAILDPPPLSAHFIHSSFLASLFPPSFLIPSLSPSLSPSLLPSLWFCPFVPPPPPSSFPPFHTLSFPFYRIPACITIHSNKKTADPTKRKRKRKRTHHLSAWSIFGNGYDGYHSKFRWRVHLGSRYSHKATILCK